MSVLLASLITSRTLWARRRCGRYRSG